MPAMGRPISRSAAARLGLVTLVAAAALAVVAWPLPSTGRPVERRIRVAASMAGFAPAVVRVPRGARVTLELHSTDVVHGLYLDGYGASVTADPGRPGELTFTADRAGTFRFRCSVTCGSLHPFIAGRLVVGYSEIFWRATLVAGLVAALALWRPWRQP